jgi:AraC family transcriptional regulator
MKTATRAHYARRIEKVVMYLADHLDEQLDLHRLAEEAHLSPYHFHRVYVAMTGETVTDTVKRQRLHRASIKLIASATPLPKLATEAGYGSVQAFNRAFREAFGMPPAAYRKRGAALSSATFRQAADSLNRNMEKLMYPVSIENRTAARVASLAHHGDYAQIGPTFERLAVWAAGRGLMTPDAQSYGIYYDDPDSLPVDRLRADACISIPDGVDTDAEHPVKTLPGGRCAVLLHTGPYSELHIAWRWLYAEWLPKSGETPADLPPFEHYLNDCRQLPPAAWQTAICVPLKG